MSIFNTGSSKAKINYNVNEPGIIIVMVFWEHYENIHKLNAVQYVSFIKHMFITIKKSMKDTNFENSIENTYYI